MCLNFAGGVHELCSVDELGFLSFQNRVNKVSAALRFVSQEGFYLYGNNRQTRRTEQLRQQLTLRQ